MLHLPYCAVGSNHALLLTLRAYALSRQPAAASLRSATNDPVVAMLNEVDAEVQVLVSVELDLAGPRSICSVVCSLPSPYFSAFVSVS